MHGLYDEGATVALTKASGVFTQSTVSSQLTVPEKSKIKQDFANFGRKQHLDLFWPLQGINNIKKLVGPKKTFTI